MLQSHICMSLVGLVDILVLSSFLGFHPRFIKMLVKNISYYLPLLKILLLSTTVEKTPFHSEALFIENIKIHAIKQHIITFMWHSASVNINIMASHWSINVENIVSMREKHVLALENELEQLLGRQLLPTAVCKM